MKNFAGSFWIVMLPNRNRKGFYPLIIVYILAVGLPLVGYAAGDADERVIDYYFGKLDSAFSNSLIFYGGRDFSFSVRSIFQETDYRGKLKSVDTALYRVSYSKGRMVSLEIIDSSVSEENVFTGEFEFPRPWTGDYIFYLYPNDTGVGPLAIGFESVDSLGNEMLSGVINLDRDDFRLMSLLVHEFDAKGFERLSRSFSFGPSGSYLIVSQIEKQGLIYRFFGRRYTLQRYEFFDYLIK